MFRRVFGHRDSGSSSNASNRTKASTSAKNVKQSAGERRLVFLSHQQSEGGDQVAAISASLQLIGCDSWTDQKVVEATAELMQEGVTNCSVFCLFLTPGVSQSWYTALEVATAIKCKKIIQCIWDPIFESEEVSVRFVSEVLFNLISNDKTLNEIANTTLQVFLERLRLDKILQYPRKLAVDGCTDFAKSILNLSLGASQFASEKKSCNSQLSLLCHPNGVDQCVLFALELYVQFEIDANIIVSNAVTDDSTVKEKLVLFVTDGVFDEPNVFSILKRARRICVAFETDLRRQCVQSAKEDFGGNASAWLQDMYRGISDPFYQSLLKAPLHLAVAFDRHSRKAIYFRDFLEQCLDCLGLITPPFSCLTDQPQSISIVSTNVAVPDSVSKAIEDWMLSSSTSEEERSTSTQQGLLVLPDDESHVQPLCNLIIDAPRPVQVVATLKLDASTTQEQLILYLSLQLFQNVKGFRSGFHSSTDVCVAAVKELTSSSLEALLAGVLLEPAAFADRPFPGAKRLICISGVESESLLREIQNISQGLADSFFVAVVLAPKAVQLAKKPPKGFLVVSSATSVGNANADISPVTAHRLAIASTVEPIWDVSVSYMAINADAARSLALDLVQCGIRNVWYDPVRASWPEIANAVVQSRKVVTLVTKDSLFTSVSVQQKEIDLCRRLQKPVIRLFDPDPFCGGGNFLVASVGNTWLPRGPARATLLQQAFGLSEEKVKHLTLADKVDQGDLLIFGDALNCGDALCDIRQILATYWGVSGIVSFQAGELLSKGLPLLVYLSEGFAASPELQVAVSETKKRGRNAVFIYDADRERFRNVLETKTGSLDFSKLKRGLTDARALAFVDSLARENEFFALQPRSRHAHTVSQHRFFDRILSKMNIASPRLQLFGNSSFDFAALPMKKAKAMEPGTREWLFAEIDQWYWDASKSSAGKPIPGIFVLLAGAGMGKSVMMAEATRRGNQDLASRLHGNASSKSARVDMYHFFDSTDPFARSALVAIKSLAMQLRLCAPGLVLPAQTQILEKERAEASLEEWLEFLILAPARALATPPVRKLLILIDAIDECSQSEAFARTLCSAWADAKRPQWLLLLISSRPEDEVVQFVSALDPLFLEPNQEENEADIAFFFRSRIATWGGCPEQEKCVSSILKQSEGLFMWAKFQEEAIHSLVAQEKISPETIAALPMGLAQVFVESFAALRKALKSDEFYERAVALALLVPREPIPEKIWKAALGVQTTQSDYEKNIVAPFARLMIFQRSEEFGRVLHLPHKTIVDWLTGTGERSARGMDREDLAIDVNRLRFYHGELATAMERTAKQPLDVFADADNFSAEWRYIALHILFHLLSAGEHERASKGWILNFNKLYYCVSCHVHRGSYSVLLSDTKNILDAVQKDSQSSELLPALDFTLTVLNLGSLAMLNDAHELAGQVLGRFDRRSDQPSNATQIVDEARQWIDATRKASGLKVAEPVGCFSGLQMSGKAVQKVLSYGSKVNAVALISNGDFVASGCMDGVIRISNVATGSEMHRLTGHTGSVTTLAVSSDERFLVSGSFDKTVCMWDLKSNQVVHVFKGHTDAVTAVHVTADGELAFSASNDFSVKVWNLRTGKEETSIASNDLRSSASSLVVFKDKNSVLVGYVDATIRLWDLSQNKEAKLFAGHEWGIMSLALSLDEQLFVSGARDCTVRMWSIASGETLRLFIGHEEAVCTVLLSPDNRSLITGSSDQTVRLWNLDNGNCKSTYAEHTDSVYSLAISSTTNQLFSGSGDGTVIVRRITDAAQEAEAGDDESTILACLLSKDCTRMFTASQDQTAAIWDVKTGEQLQVFIGHTNYVSAIAVSEDERFVFTGSWDQSARMWNAATGAMMKIFHHGVSLVSSIAVSMDRAWLATGRNDGGVHLWKISTGEQAAVWDHHLRKVTSLFITKSAAMVFSGSEDGTIRVYDPKRKSELKVIDGFQGPIHSISVDNKLLFVVQEDRSRILMWSEANGKNEKKTVGWPSHLRMCVAANQRSKLSVRLGKTVCGFTEDTPTQLLWVQNNYVYGPKGRSFALWEVR